MSIPPSNRVIEAFGGKPPAIRIRGGQETTWAAANVIIKPLDTSLEVIQWQASTFSSLMGRSDLQLSAPRKTPNGDIVLEGWTAWDRLEGSSEHQGRWDEIIRAGQIFSDIVKDVPRPPFLDARDDPWAIADRIAWGEIPADAVLHVRYIEDLLKRRSSRTPTCEASQLIHGDLTGNVLLSETHVPAVIDISPYWRPRSFATAIVVVDALTWEEAPLEWGRKYLQDDSQKQAFIRALLFRVLSDFFRCPTEPVSDLFQRSMQLLAEVFVQ